MRSQAGSCGGYSGTQDPVKSCNMRAKAAFRRPFQLRPLQAEALDLPDGTDEASSGLKSDGSIEEANGWTIVDLKTEELPQEQIAAGELQQTAKEQAARDLASANHRQGRFESRRESIEKMTEQIASELQALQTAQEQAAGGLAVLNDCAVCARG